MSHAARPGNLHRPPAIPSSIKALAAVLLALPILGIVAVVLVWARGYDGIAAYKDVYALHATVALGALDFVISFVLYLRTRLPSLQAARLLSLAWVILQILMLGSQVFAHRAATGA